MLPRLRFWAIGFHGSDGLWLRDFSSSYVIDAGLLSLAVI